MDNGKSNFGTKGGRKEKQEGKKPPESQFSNGRNFLTKHFLHAPLKEGPSVRPSVTTREKLPKTRSEPGNTLWPCTDLRRDACSDLFFQTQSRDSIRCIIVEDKRSKREKK